MQSIHEFYTNKSWTVNIFYLPCQLSLLSIFTGKNLASWIEGIKLDMNWVGPTSFFVK